MTTHFSDGDQEQRRFEAPGVQDDSQATARSRASRRKSRTLVAACFEVGILASASLGYATGSASSTPDPLQGGSVAERVDVLAVAADGDTVALTADEAETFDEFTTPIDQEEVTFESNVDLTPAEVEDRQDGLSEDYDVGDPLSLEDLEFMRAYLIEAEPASDGGSTVVETAAFEGSQNAAAPAALYNLNQSFNVTRSGAGATANANGRITGGINVVDAYWGASWTTKRTGGKALSKITSSVTADAFGAVGGWPYVGKIYSKTLSATSPSGVSSWSFSRSGRVTGAVAYMQVDCRSYVYTSSGSFSLP